MPAFDWKILVYTKICKVKSQATSVTKLLKPL